MNLDLWKRRKKEMKLTHDMLAEKSGISRRTVAGIFSGDPRYSSPTLNTVQAIESALGLCEDGAGGASYDAPLTESEKRMLDAYRLVGERHGARGQERAIEIVELAFLRE